MFTREAPAGEACLVPPDVSLCIGQRMVLFRVDDRIVPGEWLVNSIYSGPAQRFIDVLSHATTVAHLNMSDIPDIPIVVPPADQRRPLLEVIRGEVLLIYTASQKLNEQIDLLVERRQALITAAVTGELEVPGGWRREAG